MQPEPAMTRLLLLFGKQDTFLLNILVDSFKSLSAALYLLNMGERRSPAQQQDKQQSTAAR